VSQVRSAFEDLLRLGTGVAGANTYPVQVVTGAQRAYVGVGVARNPLLFVETAGSDGAVLPPDTHLANIRVSHGAPCTLRLSNGEETRGAFTIIECLISEPAIVAMFLDACAVILYRIAERRTPLELDQSIAYLVELFKRLGQHASKTAAGLWAELFLIHRASSRARAVAVWHTVPEAVHDFASGMSRLEVKSTRGVVRQHSFSLRQLTEPIGARIIVASLFVQPSAAGVSLGDLYRDIRLSCGRRLASIEHIDQVVFGTLGDTTPRALEERFDYDLAARTLAFFEANSVPRVATPVPDEVTDVRFRSDLARVAAALPQSLSSDELFRLFVPQT
jgi:Putative  PD-(D/E)XK family member, (DUF4420)